MSETVSVLQFVVKNSWVADNLRSLGPGRIYHLAYRADDMDPAVVRDLEQGLLGPGARAEVALVEPGGEPVPVADVEVLEVHDFSTYCRFDFRIQRLHPRGAGAQHPPYMCRYVTRTP